MLDVAPTSEQDCNTLECLHSRQKSDGRASRGVVALIHCMLLMKSEAWAGPTAKTYSNA
ncbi:hypothetical protein DHODJN_25945 [Methylorubrum extorquens]